MTKQEQLDKFEELFMMFGVSLGTYGNIINEQNFDDDNVAMLAWQVSNKLENLYKEIERDIDFIKRLNK